ncbi:D-glucuronyl C5-epimerase family protein [Thermococcus sp. SY098]|uniref:D-glucuronyl C5-epimerase family protein n=1 Tax=Thermococcus sp. SY098 TaxID=3111325 RepID=UPI002D777E44|nr:D-glucuronyl C5-epimerase family protein [Thermococcus sp. SY098]WRS53522.1 D-glucuronyl C5-epimerase family protein [Thermococcus sp. SY098]
MGSSMKQVRIFTFLVIVILSSGCISVETSFHSHNHNYPIKVFVQIEEENAIFEIAKFELTVGNVTIDRLDTPIFVGRVGIDNGKVPIVFTVKGTLINWYGKSFKVKELLSAIFNATSNDEILITLKIYKEDDTFRVGIDEKKSGIIGRDVPEDVFLSPETALLKTAKGTKFYEELAEEIGKNEKIKSKLLDEYKRTGNLTYLKSYRDSFYTIRVFGELAKWRRLSKVEYRILLAELKANNAYYSHYTSPTKDFSALVFSDDSPYYSTFRMKDSLNSSLPFVYYTGRGFNLYPVTAIHWAEMYFQRGQNEKALQILKELSQYAQYGEYGGKEYVLFKNYFHFENSSIPWVSGYAQGMGAGVYAIAYNLTGNETYLRIAKGLVNSFDLPPSMNGFVSHTKYGDWYLEYNYNSNELVLNGHIIALQGLYYYWQVTNDEKAWLLFQKGVQAVRNALPIFDTGSWSRYSNIHGDASEFYHRLHIRLLKWLYDVTGDKYFLEYARKWNDYLMIRGLKPEKI